MTPKTPANANGGFVFALGETVNVMIRGEIIEQIHNDNGRQYLIKQTLANGKIACQRIKEEHTFGADLSVRVAA